MYAMARKGVVYPFGMFHYISLPKHKLSNIELLSFDEVDTGCYAHEDRNIGRGLQVRNIRYLLNKKTVILYYMTTLTTESKKTCVLPLATPKPLGFTSSAELY